MFLKNISLGIYYPGRSLLHRLQSRTKLLVIFMMVAALVVAGRSYWDFTPYFVAFSLVLVGVFCSGISLREMWRRLWLLVTIVLLSVLLGLFTPANASDSGRVFSVLPPLILSPAFFLGALLCIGLATALYCLLALLPLSTLHRASVQRWLRRSRIVAIFVLITLVLAGLSALERPAGAAPRVAYMITYDNVWYSGIFLALFLILYPCSLLLTMTTSPVALIEGLTMLMAPLRWLRLPVDDFALMLLLALRFIPTLVEEIEQLVKAQAARGASLDSGSPRERIQSMLALFVPFMRNTLRRASELATALDARGYQVDGHQTHLHEKKLALADYLVLLVMGSVLLAALLI